MSDAAKTLELVIKKIDELPTLPTIVYELNKVISNPMSSTSDVERIMSNDQALTTRVLKLVNSAYYAIPGGVNNLSRAIAYLGFDAVQQLVLSSAVLDILQTDKQDSSFDILQYWKHSIGTAMAAETIAKFINYQAPADLFTCGLLHDVGKLALFIVDVELLEKACAEALATNTNLDQAENQLNTVKHTAVGNALLKKWQLPAKIQHVAKYHHTMDPAKRIGVTGDGNEVIDIVCLANLLIHALKFGASGHSKVLGAPKALLLRLKIDSAAISALVDKIKTALIDTDAFMQMAGGG